MALAGNIGALIQPAGPGHIAQQFFAEDQGLYVATVDDAHLPEFLTGAAADRVEGERLGRTAGKRLNFEMHENRTTRVGYGKTVLVTVDIVGVRDLKKQK